MGGCSIDKYGTPLTDSVLEKCRQSKAILLGAVGGPKWASTDPEKPQARGCAFKAAKGAGPLCKLKANKSI